MDLKQIEQKNECINKIKNFSFIPVWNAKTAGGAADTQDTEGDRILLKEEEPS